jgi:phage terminase large subunit
MTLEELQRRLETLEGKTYHAQPQGTSLALWNGNDPSEPDAFQRVSKGALRWMDDPVAFVRQVFGAEPEPWQLRALKALPSKSRVALMASKGCGKSCLDAWAVWWFLMMHPHSRVVVVSISGANLADALWSELAYWFSKSQILQQAFVVMKERIYAKGAEATWWASARSWPRTADPREQANTLSGVHADYVLFVLDECGAMPPAVLVSAEAALSTCKRGIVLISGNPTNLDGLLYDACVTHAAHWHVVRVTGAPDDPERSPRVSVQWAREMIQMWGRDSNYCRINIFAEWPTASQNSLIGPEEIEAAYKRNYVADDFEWAPKILGCDIAGMGDDSTVIFPRQGCVAFKPVQLRQVSGYEIASRIAGIVGAWGGRDVRIVLDGTGGYAGAVAEALRSMGLVPILVGFAERAEDPKYANRRAEMYWRMTTAIKETLRLPPECRELMMLAKLEYGFNGDKLILEKKEEFKARVGQSPDHGDALALSFAVHFGLEHRVQPMQDAPMLGPGDFSRYERSYQWAQKQQAAASMERELRDYHPFAASWNQKPPGSGYPQRGSWRGIGGRNGGF